MSLLRVLSHPVAGEFPHIAPRSTRWPAELSAAILPGAAAERLRLPHALVVTTGQQPGLFGGPLYTLHKALAAAALANELERAWQRPVVPVFWLAGDDHDWTEAAQTAWWNSRDDVIHWSLSPRAPGAPSRSLTHELLSEELATARGHLATDLPAGVARDYCLDWLERHWVVGRTMQSAFASGVSELLEPFGIACFDASHVALKRLQVPLISAALERAAELDAALAAPSNEAPSVVVGDGATLVFLEDSAGRDRLIMNDGGFRTRRGGHQWTLDALRAKLETSPESFSANVLLRPVVEAALLPTVAYVAGPGELRYLKHQAARLYPLFDVAPQAVVPRWAGTVIDQVTERLLARIGHSADEVMADGGALAAAVLRQDFPPKAAAALSDLAEAIAASSATLGQVGHAIDPVLDRAIEGRRRRLALIHTDLERLLERHLRRREDIAYSQYRRLQHRLRPQGQPQERVIGAAGALGRWGEDWLPAVAAAAGGWAADRVETMPGVP